MFYYPRVMEKALEKLAKSYPILVISGPRQSGKSTLVKNMFPRYGYVNLEGPDERMMAQEDPRGFLERFKDNVIIDEIQYVPLLFSYIQSLVDEKKRKIQFILTGSSQLDLLEGVSQSLAGRACILQLFPLCLEEIRHKEKPASLEEILFSGGYPGIHFDRIPVVDWYQDYCHNYLERDVRRITVIRNLGTFQLFLKMCAARCGQIINYSGFANDCGISPNTVKEWMNILEASFIIFKLNPYYKSYKKRLTKASKLYFYDTGLVCSLLGITSSESLRVHSIRGGLFESWVISEFQKKYANIHRRAPLYYWRNNQGMEMDIIMEKLEQFIVLEIKSGKTLNKSFFKNLDVFDRIAKGDIHSKYIVYGGDQSQKRNDIQVVSWKKLDMVPFS